MRVVDHSDCEYNTKKHNGYINISHGACQAAWDATAYPMPPVRRHGMQHHIPCRLPGGMGYHNISHAPCHTAYDITSYYMLRARLALVFVLAGGC